jgi:hypothetical protein
MALFVYSWQMTVSQLTYRQITGSIMNNELGMDYEGNIRDVIKLGSWNLYRRISTKTDAASPDIRTWHLQNRSPERYCYDMPCELM